MTITLTDFKIYLGRGSADTSDDTLLEWAVASANEAITEYTGRTFVTLPATDDEDYPADVKRVFRSSSYFTLVDDMVSVVGVETSDDNITWTTITGWWMEPFDVVPQYRLYTPTCSRFVRVEGVPGYGSVPAAVRQAACLIANRIYRRKESPDGTIAMGGDFAIRVSRFEDPDAARLLDPLRRVDRVMGLA